MNFDIIFDADGLKKSLPLEVPNRGAGVMAFSDLLRLWRPEYLEVEFRGFEGSMASSECVRKRFPVADHAENPNQPVNLEAFLKAEVEALGSAPEFYSDGWGVHHICSSGNGWSRLVLPDGVSSDGEWSAMILQGNVVPQVVRVKPADSVNGRASIWLLTSGATGTSIGLMNNGQPNARLELELGVTYSTGTDPREASTLIRGASLTDWEQVNVEFLAGLAQNLQQTNP